MTKQVGKPELNWAQALGSALAALSSAVLLSTLGATGTLIGAALGSVLVTVGGTVYSHYLAVSRERMAAARSAALMRASLARGRTRRVSTRGGTEAVTQTIAQSPERFPLLAGSVTGAHPTGASGPRLIDGKLPRARSPWREMLRGLRWKPALAASLGVFVLVMGVIVSMELVTGRALSSYTGGSSADGPRTTLTLLGSSTDTSGRDSATSERDGRADRGSAGSAERTGETTGTDAGSAGADTGGGSSTGSDAGTDAPPSDTSTSEPDAVTPTEPAPTPEAPTAPAPEPAPAPTTQAPVEAPAPSAGTGTGTAMSGAAAQSAS